MSSDPLPDGPVSREAPPPPGTDLPDLVDEIEQRVGTEVQQEVHGGADGAEQARTAEADDAPSGDVVADGRQASDDAQQHGAARGAADPTLNDDSPGGDDSTDGMPRSEPSD